MTARDTYAATVASAHVTKAAAVAVAITAAQETIEQSRTVVGYTLQSGNYANLAAAVKAANIAKLNAIFAAEQAKQAAIAAARDTLRASGDLGSL